MVDERRGRWRRVVLTENRTSTLDGSMFERFRSDIQMTSNASLVILAFDLNKIQSNLPTDELPFPLKNTASRLLPE